MEECTMIKVYGTNAREYVEEKLGFVEDFAQGDVEVRIKETKSTDLRVATITYRLKGHPESVYISTEETRSVKKAIDVLADKVSVKIAKDQNKYKARKRKKRRKVKEEQLKREEALLEEELDIEELEHEVVNGKEE